MDDGCAFNGQFGAVYGPPTSTLVGDRKHQALLNTGDLPAITQELISLASAPPTAHLVDERERTHRYIRLDSDVTRVQVANLRPPALAR